MQDNQNAGAAQKLSQISDARGFNEWLTERQQAHEKVGETLAQLVDDGVLSPIEAGRTYASAVSAIVGYDELIAQGSPGPALTFESMFGTSRQPSSVS